MPFHRIFQHKLSIASAALCLCAAAQAQQPAHEQDKQPVVVSGSVPDEASKAAIIARLHELYGSTRVVDQISVGGVNAPADWAALVPKLITKNLRSVHKGQLVVEGADVAIRGEVPNEALRQEITAGISGGLHSGYTVKNGLRVTADSQSVLDNVLANRLIEFENGSAQLTENGTLILDEIAEAVRKSNTGAMEVIGHTDNVGQPAQNLALSRARAQSVKNYLVSKGIRSESIATSGMGADQPVASNETSDGRKRNRRIEFRATR